MHTLNPFVLISILLQVSYTSLLRVNHIRHLIWSLSFSFWRINDAFFEEYLKIPAYPDDVLVSSKFSSFDNENEALPTIQDITLFSNFFSFYWSEDYFPSFKFPAFDNNWTIQHLKAHVSSRRPLYFSFLSLSIQLSAPLPSLFDIYVSFLLFCDCPCFEVVSYFTKHFWHYF